MAGKRKTRTGKWEYVVKRAGVLERPLYLTFDTEREGDAHVARLEAMLDRGIVPDEYRPRSGVQTIRELVREFEREAHPSAKDQGALRSVVATHGTLQLGAITASWVDDWIATMKRVDKLAPATIRAKVGALARATDWGMRKGFLAMPDHPLRTLPDGYAQYSKMDEALAGVKREDVERDRRLEPGEYERVLAVIDGGVLPRKQRPMQLPDPRALRMLFTLALESAMRLRELYTLTIGQVDLARRTVFLDKTKNGDKRQVPLSSVALAELQAYLPKGAAPEAQVFPWWNGQTDRRSLHRATDMLSKLFVDIFETAGCVDLGFHDLRHEATSRLFERTQLSEMQISKITGHRSMRMLARYANLRGSDLAAKLW